MPTGRSWTESAVDAVADTGHLLAFRAGTVRRPRAAAAGGVAGLAITLLAAVLPAYVDEARPGARAALVELLPSMFAGLLVLTTLAAVATGGGRELLPREQSAIHPIGPTTDHLGALVLAPLNLAWLVQAWLLLGAVAHAAGPGALVRAQVVTLLWLVAATALAQLVGWVVEAVRRGPHGVLLVRGGLVVLGGTGLVLQLSGRLVEVLDTAAGRWIAAAAVSGSPMVWIAAVLGLAALALAAVVAGAWPAGAALRRTPRDELKVESGTRQARPMPGSDLAMLLRFDRASVWRTVPMRRGLVVLALGPGMVAVAGGMEWASVIVLPGLVVSGAALLFGVNAWALDGRGVLWRESLPVPPRLVFASRTLVVVEVLLLASAVTLLLGALRAGPPSAAELAAVLCTWLVVTWQVTAVSMVWSVRRPFAVDLRSARATPAPPVVMVGHSARLALTTTLTAMLFTGLAQVPVWWLSVVVAVPFLAWSTVRLRRARRVWLDAERRAAVVVTVAG